MEKRQAHCLSRNCQNHSPKQWTLFLLLKGLLCHLRAITILDHILKEFREYILLEGKQL